MLPNFSEQEYYLIKLRKLYNLLISQIFENSACFKYAQIVASKFLSYSCRPFSTLESRDFAALITYPSQPWAFTERALLAHKAKPKQFIVDFFAQPNRFATLHIFPYPSQSDLTSCCCTPNQGFYLGLVVLKPGFTCFSHS